MIVHFASSGGGHLEELQASAVLLRQEERVWVTTNSPRASALSGAGEAVRVLPTDARGVAQVLRLLAASVLIAVRDRPRIVVTTGSYAAVPFCLAARLLGARLIFVETGARVLAPSRTGRILAPVASRVYVQWPALVGALSGAVLLRPILLEAVEATGARPGAGAVAVMGTHPAPFQRLVAAVVHAVRAAVLPEPVFIQRGPLAASPAGIESVEYLTPTEIEERIANAAVVICHAGLGTIACALRAGRRPLVMARTTRDGEHVDNHQREIVDALAALGVVVPLGAVIRPEDVARALEPLAVDTTGTDAASLRQIVRQEADHPVGASPVGWLQARIRRARRPDNGL